MATFLIDGEVCNGLAESILEPALEYVEQQIALNAQVSAGTVRRAEDLRHWPLKPGMPIVLSNYSGLVRGDVLLCGVESELTTDQTMKFSCYVVTHSFRAVTRGLGKSVCHNLYCILNPPLVQMRLTLNVDLLHYNWWVLRLARLEHNCLEKLKL